MKSTPLGSESLKLVSFCPLCEMRHQGTQARVLAEDGEMRLMHVTCKKCAGTTIALVMQSDAGASTVGLVTDLSHDDVLRFHEGRRVTTDDVIEVHEALGKGLATLLNVPTRTRRTRAKAQTARIS